MVSKSVEVKVPIIGSVHMKSLLESIIYGSIIIWILSSCMMMMIDDDAVGKSVSTRAE